VFFCFATVLIPSSSFFHCYRPDGIVTHLFHLSTDQYSGQNPVPNYAINSDELKSSIREDCSPGANQQSNRNIHKRVRKGDNSFEQEHRDASSEQHRAKIDTMKNFNNSTYRKSTTYVCQASHYSTIAGQYASSIVTNVSTLLYQRSDTFRALDHQRCKPPMQYKRMVQSMLILWQEKSILIYANSAVQIGRLMRENV
jgi:hypothetical protein